MSSQLEPASLTALRQATREGGLRSPDVEIARGARPPIFDADAARAVSSLFMAAFVVAAAIFRERVSSASFDLMALVLRAAALAFCVRCLLSLFVWVRRLRRDLGASRYVLAWSADALLLRAPHGETWVARSDVLGIAQPEAPQNRRVVPPAPRPLALVLKPEQGLRTLELPPYFAADQAILAARLTRWLEQPSRAAAERFDPPKPNPEARYTRIASGKLEAGEVSVPEGRGYLLRAPYGVLLGCAFAADALRAAGPLAPRLMPGVIAACLLALAFLGGWLLWMQRREKSRLGIAMALTREEMLLRGKAGTVSIPWGQLLDVEVYTRLAWSPFFGSYPVQQLLLHTTDGAQTVFDAGFLGVAPEVVAVLCESYRRRDI